MAIFIMSPEHDIHGGRIEWGLRQSGFEVIRWSGLGWQREQNASINFGTRDGVYLGDHRIDSKDTFWFRRQSLVTHPRVAIADEKFAHGEYRAFLKTLLVNIEWTGAFCVNKGSAVQLIENKSVQLTLASRCGLRIPATVMANTYRFVGELQDTLTDDVVHKSYRPHSWFDQESGILCGTETTYLDRDDRFADEVYAYAPGIYQQKVQKEFDVRITMIGADFHAFAVSTVDKALDWRTSGMFGKVSVERIQLPDDVQAGLRKFAHAADIVFGCFDMAVDYAGAWWFLEVNQAGQFLWIDELLPDDGLYQPMLKLLSSREDLGDVKFPPYRDCIEQCPKQDDSVPLSKDLPYLTLEA